MTPSTIGIDLGGTKSLILSDELEEKSATLEARLRRFVAAHALNPAAIGIASPGLIDPEGRIAVCDVLPKFAGWNPRESLADLGARIVVMNDVKAALAEEMHDAAPGETVGVVMAGTAVGAAFIAEGRPLVGASGWAGELGHVPIAIGGKKVRRLDQLAGGSFIAAGLGVSGAELVRLANAGHAAALEAIRRGGFALGLGLATAINLLNPSRLAVGGGAASLPGYWESALDSASRHSIPQMFRQCRLSRVRAGARVAAKGAIRLASA